MSKRFKPVIKHDVVTQTYTIRDEKGIVIQVPDVIIDNLDSRYKAERDTLIDDLPWYKAKVSRLEQRHSKLVDENTRLQNKLYTMGLNQDEADDKTKELERENEELVWTLKNKEDVIDWNCLKIRVLKEDVEKYKRGISNLINENELKNNLLSEISQHIGNKPSSSTYKYFRGKLDGVGIKEGE